MYPSKTIRRHPNKLSTIRKASSKEETTTSSSLDWTNFDYSISPKQDTRFSPSFQSIVQTPDEHLHSVIASETKQDLDAQRKLQSKNDALMNLDQDLVKKATEIIMPYVQEKRVERLDEILDKRTKKVRFLFENPANPSNVWACLRTIDSFGIQNVDIVVNSQHYTGKSALGQKQGMRTAMGSAKWLTIHSYPNTTQAVQELKLQGYTIVVSDLNPNSVDIREIDWGGYGDEDCEDNKICVVMGNEERGISDEMRSLADASFLLPMRGFAESFNLSVATAITLAYMSSYTRMNLFPPDLSRKEKNCLRLKWLLQSLAKRKVGKALLKQNGVVLPKVIDSL